MEEVPNSCKGILPLISTLRYRWTVSGFFSWLFFVVFLVFFGAYISSRVSVLPREPKSLVPVNTDPTDRYCRRWLDVVYSYNECQESRGISGGR